MASRRFNIWMDDDLINRVKVAGATLGIKAAAFIRMGTIEKLARTPCQQRELGPRGHQKKTAS